MNILDRLLPPRRRARAYRGMGGRCLYKPDMRNVCFNFLRKRKDGTYEAVCQTCAELIEQRRAAARGIA